VIVFNENSLRRTLNSYFDYYHRSRTHLSLERTHRSHERFSRRKWERSWGYRRSVGCITATNDGLPEKPESTRLRAASPRGFEISVRTVLTCTRVHRRISFARLRQGRDLLTLFASPREMASEAGRTELSLGTIRATTETCSSRRLMIGNGSGRRARNRVVFGEKLELVLELPSKRYFSGKLKEAFDSP
jgi:hypothetical protein